MNDNAATAADQSPSSEKSKRSWLRRLLQGTLIGLVILTVVVALGFRVLVRRPFPTVEGTLTLTGLTSDVEVIRDSMGIPHIYADTPADLFMAQGFVHAQDRFFQMDFWRHIAEGRLSEMFGSAQLETDRFLRTLGWGEVAKAEYAADTPVNRALVDAYSAGVNAYLGQRSPSELGFEYSIIELLNHAYDPEPWSSYQSIAWGKVMAWDLGGNMSAEIERAMALGVLPEDRAAQLFPSYPGDRHPYIIPSDSPAESGIRASATVPDGAIDLLGGVYTGVKAINDLTGGSVSDGVGSNSWVVSGDHTPTGAPILANDPHLGISMPSIWYQVGLHCRVVSADCPFDVAGFSFAGMPGVVIGHNADIAWAFTNVGPDVQDLYIEKLNPDNPNQYELNGEWVDMDLTTVELGVGGGDPEELTIRRSIHGPIVSGIYGPLDEFDNAGVEIPEDYAVALKWTGLEPVTSLIAPIIGLNTASNFEEFKEAALLFDVPSQNMLYADTEGNIGYQVPGAIPIRSQGDGTIPVPGWTGEYEWEGFIPEDELPWVLNPDSGWIVTANNAVIDDDYPYLLTEDWSYGYRAKRAVDLVVSNLGMSLDDHGVAQFDSYDLNAEFALPYVLDALKSADVDASDQDRDALSELTDWDLQNFAGSTGAAVWNATWRNLLVRTFHDELPEDIHPKGGSKWFEVVRNLLMDANDAFWDDVTTGSVVETRDDILIASFFDGVDEVTDLIGTTVDDWTWGEMHGAVFENQSLGQSGIGLIEDRFNRGPYPASGGKSIVNAVGWDATEGYQVDWLPSMRMLVDLDDLTRSQAVHTTGQSGHTDHPHYDDMIPLWLAGDNIPMLWDRADIEADAEATLVLTPQGG